MFNLNINNFRGFNETDIDISNINILIGENSGGKSSFIKLLLLLKQSMESPSKNRKIVVDGHLLDLGNFDSFINHKSDNKTFSVSLKTDDEYIKYFINGIIEENNSIDEFTNKNSYFLSEPTILTFHFTKEDNELFTNNIEIYNKNIGTLVMNITNENKLFSDLENIDGEVILEHIKYGKINIKDKFTVYGFMFLVSPEPILKYDEENNTSLFNEFAFLLFSQNYFASLLRSIKYINPVKFQPTRILLKRDISNNKNIKDYETLINVLASLKESNEKKSNQILMNFNSAIKELGIADEIKLETNSSIPVTELKVKIANSWNSIIDVGYGVGLQIPILLQVIISSILNSKDILIIEQPEIHLHPALHSKFIEILIKYSGSTKLIIETHSEHIIRKLQVLAKKEIINSEEIKIYYFKNNNGTFDITKHRILHSGKLEPVFPKGFYDNSYSLSKELY
jgi:predicted ATPase